MDPAKQQAIINDAVKLAETRSPSDTVYGIPAPSIDAPELQREDGWVIIGWVQVHAAMGITSYLVGWNRETGDRTIRKGWAPVEAA